MSVSIYQMRVAVLAAYPGQKWAAKVARMGDNQIIRLYLKFKEEGKLK